LNTRVSNRAHIGYDDILAAKKRFPYFVPKTSVFGA